MTDCITLACVTFMLSTMYYNQLILNHVFFHLKTCPKKEIRLVKKKKKHSELLTLLKQVYSSAPLLVFSRTVFSQGQ